MSRRQPLQIYLPPDIDQHVRDAAQKTGDTISGWLRGAVLRACDPEIEAALVRIERDLIFATVALDALLLANEDTGLRDRTLKAFSRKLKRRALTHPALWSDGDEA
jgi:hypothetical protein